MKTREELYFILQYGTEEEKGEALELLSEYDQRTKNSCISGGAVAICTRNLSHGAGDFVKEEILQQRIKKLEAENEGLNSRLRVAEKYLNNLIEGLDSLRTDLEVLQKHRKDLSEE